MDGHTYTYLWLLQRRLYAIQDIVLPVPVPLVKLGVFLAVLGGWWFLVTALGLDSLMAVFGEYQSGMTGSLVLVVPIVAAWATGRPLVDGRTVVQHLSAAAQYQLLPDRLVRMEAPDRQQSPVRIGATVWTPTTKGNR